jgi:hypothetical protein
MKKNNSFPIGEICMIYEQSKVWKKELIESTKDAKQVVEKERF